MTPARYREHVRRMACIVFDSLAVSDDAAADPAGIPALARGVVDASATFRACAAHVRDAIAADVAADARRAWGGFA